MKLVQARVPEAEFDLLRRKARAEGTTLQEWVRRAIRERLLPDTIEPADPLARAFPLTAGKGRRLRTNVAEEHDRLLYGAHE